MELHIYKTSPRRTHPHTHPSALWAVRELPCLVLAKEWLPEMGHHDWIVLFDEFLPVDRSPDAMQASPEEIYRSEEIYQHMIGQRFSSRGDALQALSVARMIHI